MKVTLTIDGKIVRVGKGTSLIEAAATVGTSIPTLCHHRLLKPYGACRLCVVEVVKRGRRRLVTSCNYPAEDGLEVLCDTTEVRKSRRLTLELLLARCPEVPALSEMARRLGVTSSRFRFQRGDRCILCGLCVRVCDELVGARAIGLANRGIDREVAAPFHDVSETCIACGCCTYICPTGCIEMVPNGASMALRLSGHTLNECTNAYRCTSCAIDNDFRTALENAIAAFRNAGS